MNFASCADITFKITVHIKNFTVTLEYKVLQDACVYNALILNVATPENSPDFLS